MNPFVERHQAEVSGVLSCFDRVVITGTLPEIGYAAAMTQLLASRGIRVFDYTQWAEPLREELRQNAAILILANSACFRLRGRRLEAVQHEGRQRRPAVEAQVGGQGTDVVEQALA